MDRIQLSQLRDIAIEYLPAAQQYREEVKTRPTEDRESQGYARALWRIADEIFARHEATAEELAAALLLNGITSYELYDPSDAAPATLYKARGIDTAPEKMRAAMQQGITNAAKTLANVTGRDIPMVDPMAHCFDAPAAPATEQVDLSLADVVRINKAARLMGCTVKSLLRQAANNERLLYVALKPHSQTLSVMPAWPNPMYPNPKLLTLSTNDVMFVAMMAHYAESLATFGSAEISQYQAGFEGVFDGHYWMLNAPQTVGLDRVYVPRSQLPAAPGTPENGDQAPPAADAGAPAIVKAVATPAIQTEKTNPWLIVDPRDPPPAQPWYTPARYFARQLVKEDSTLLVKRSILADKVAKSLVATKIKNGRGKVKFDTGTILKAFANVSFG